MKIIIGGFSHESNTFNPILTSKEDFVVLRGDEIYQALDYHEPAKGIIKTLEQWPEYEICTTLFARAVPNGVIEKKFYLGIKNELLERASLHRDAVAIVLALHGSMRVEDIGEAEGDLLKDLRAMFPDIPIISALDLHATITDTMIAHADAFVGYKTAPHVDCFETGKHAAELARYTLTTGQPLTMAYQRIPMIIAGEKSETSVKPTSTMIEQLRIAEQENDILAASFLLGFPWADTEDNGVCSLVVTQNNQEKAEEKASQLAKVFWDTRQQFDFTTEAYLPEEAIKQALMEKRSPVFLSDSGDNPTAGSTGDNTGFLELLYHHPGINELNEPLVFTGIYDPDSVKKCAGQEGQAVKLELGGKFDQVNCLPLQLTGIVKKYVKSWGDYQSDLVLFHSGGIEIVITSKHIGFVHPSMLEALDINPSDRKIIAIKLGYLTDPYKKIAARSIIALTNGCTDEILERLPYKKMKRPIYPLDKDMN
ncbi:MAG: M81 family metallopeptidase [Spirochaetes bacterium]|nr:M81 family metallopeptidase [Spirochaetota bacterium]